MSAMHWKISGEFNLWEAQIEILAYSQKKRSHNKLVHSLLYGLLKNDADRLCGLVVRVPGYRSRGPCFDSRRYQIF
jgi:hypothetical protein